MKQHFQCDRWSVTYTPEDGGRLNELKYARTGLLTPEPSSFHPPVADYGQYETRPVFGYDDCLPTVDTCVFPGRDLQVPDHGELCWLRWDVTERADSLLFSVQSEMLPVKFQREMRFTESTLNWIFRLSNTGDTQLPFLHVMHALMPLTEIVDFELPEFDSVYDEISGQAVDLPDAGAIRKFLTGQPAGSASMLILRNVVDGNINIHFKSGIRLAVTFPRALFRSIGIWWNHDGYPGEAKCRRNECAFEPIPGPDSSLSHSHEAHACLWVKPQQHIEWRVQWFLECQDGDTGNLIGTPGTG